MTLVSLLRGVNLGPHRRIKMDDLRKVYEAAGMKEPKTFLQSGNVVFKTSERDPAQTGRKLEKAIEKSFGFRSEVIIRTAAEMAQVVERNPFANRKGIEPNRFLVWFLASDPGEEARQKLRAIDCRPEELVAIGRELYIYFPNGLARPKLSFTRLDKVLQVAGTGRNWNSVTKLAEISGGES